MHPFLPTLVWAVVFYFQQQESQLEPHPILGEVPKWYCVGTTYNFTWQQLVKTMVQTDNHGRAKLHIMGYLTCWWSSVLSQTLLLSRKYQLSTWSVQTQLSKVIFHFSKPPQKRVMLNKGKCPWSRGTPVPGRNQSFKSTGFDFLEICTGDSSLSSNKGVYFSASL